MTKTIQKAYQKAAEVLISSKNGDITRGQALEIQLNLLNNLLVEVNNLPHDYHKNIQNDIYVLKSLQN